MFAPDKQQIALQLAARIEAIDQHRIAARLLQQQHMAGRISLGHLDREQARADSSVPRKALRQIEQQRKLSQLSASLYYAYVEGLK